MNIEVLKIGFYIEKKKEKKEFGYEIKMMNRIFFGIGVFGKLWKFYTRRIGMIRVEFYDLEIFSNIVF